MKMRTLLLITVFGMSCLLPEGLIPSAVADCGKIIIIKHPKPRPPRKPNCEPVIPPVLPNVNKQKQEQTLNNINQNIQFNLQLTPEMTRTLLGLLSAGNLPGNIPLGGGDIPLPPVTPLPSDIPPYALDNNGGDVPFFDELPSAGSWGFKEPNQQAIIAWNGNKEVLILTTNEVSAGEAGAALSILPLPGKPISIERSNAKIFAATKGLLDKKWAAGQGSGAMGVYMEKKIGSHSIFVWKMDNISTFEQEVKAYVETTYKGEATALITPQILKVIEGYFKRGFRYFAFDITELSTKTVSKEAIAYEFESKAAYFPLVISQIGGVGDTDIDLIVMTPGAINNSTYNPDTNITNVRIMLNGKGTVSFTNKELNALDPKLSNLFGGNDNVQVRNLLIAGPINSFGQDFIAK